MNWLKAVIVERRLRWESSHLHELKSLAEAAGYTIAGRLEQVKTRDSGFQIGRGKVEELATLVKGTGAEKVIFENELTPFQAYNLAKPTGVEVISKFQLILEVFTNHASTQEAKLQIELARLHYELTRAREKVRLARRGEQPGFRGLGKYEVQVYHDTIKRRVVNIKSKLKELKEEKRVQRSKRVALGIPTVSLSGYTAAGKSTLFNALTGEDARVTGSLFTTLSTKLSAVNFDGKKALLADTVGFIDGLPLKLIEAFRATLEETIFSSTIILVVDCSEVLSEVKRKVKCCLDTLRSIGVTATPIVTAMNKIDLMTPLKVETIIGELKDYAPNPVPVSALKGVNLEQLREVVSAQLKDFVKASFELPISSRSLSVLSKIRRYSTVLDQSYGEKAIQLKVESLNCIMDKIKALVEKVGGRILKAT